MPKQLWKPFIYNKNDTNYFVSNLGNFKNKKNKSLLIRKKQKVNYVIIYVKKTKIIYFIDTQQILDNFFTENKPNDMYDDKSGNSADYRILENINLCYDSISVKEIDKILKDFT